LAQDFTLLDIPIASGNLDPEPDQIKRNSYRRVFRLITYFIQLLTTSTNTAYKFAKALLNPPEVEKGFTLTWTVQAHKTRGKA